MTVSVPSNLIRSYAGDGSTVNFSYPIRFDADDELVVVLRSAGGVDTTQTLGSNYTVAGEGTASGVVTFLTAPASGVTVLIYRATEETQVVDLEDAARNPAEAVELQMDRTVRMIQDHKELLSRSVVMRPGSQGVVFPEPSDGKFIGWNGSELANFAAADVGGELLPLVANTIIKRNAANTAFETKPVGTTGLAVLGAETEEEARGALGISDFPTRSAANASSLAVAPDYIRTAGYASVGDGGGSLYKKVASEPAHAGKFSITLSDAVTVVWYELAENVADIRAFGAVVNGTTSDDILPHLSDAKTYATSKGVPIEISGGTFYLSAPVDVDGINVIVDPLSEILATSDSLPIAAFRKSGQLSNVDMSTKLDASTGKANVDAEINHGPIKQLINHSTLGGSGEGPHMNKLDMWYDGTADNAHLLNGVNHYGFIQYGEKKKADGARASGTVGIYGGHVNVFSVETPSGGSGVSEITPIAVGVNFKSDANIAPRVNLYNDFVVSGPVNSDPYFRENFMAGASFLVNKYCPLNTLDSGYAGSYGVCIATRPQVGGFAPDAHTTDSYTLRAGLVVAGYAGPQSVTHGRDASATEGFTYGVLVGGGAEDPNYFGGGSQWLPSTARSKIAYGVFISDYTDTGLVIKHPHPDHTGNAVTVAYGAGTVQIDTQLKLQNIPDTDPHILGVLWRSGTDIKVSLG